MWNSWSKIEFSNINYYFSWIPVKRVSIIYLKESFYFKKQGKEMQKREYLHHCPFTVVCTFLTLYHDCHIRKISFIHIAMSKKWFVLPMAISLWSGKGSQKFRNFNPFMPCSVIFLISMFSIVCLWLISLNNVKMSTQMFHRCNVRER